MRETATISKPKIKPKKTDDVNLTVFITVADEKNVSPAQKEAIRQVREVYAQWLREEK